jgi:hypothetical protein
VSVYTRGRITGVYLIYQRRDQVSVYARGGIRCLDISDWWDQVSM